MSAGNAGRQSRDVHGHSTVGRRRTGGGWRSPRYQGKRRARPGDARWRRINQGLHRTIGGTAGELPVVTGTEVMASELNVHTIAEVHSRSARIIESGGRLAGSIPSPQYHVTIDGGRRRAADSARQAETRRQRIAQDRGDAVRIGVLRKGRQVPAARTQFAGIVGDLYQVAGAKRVATSWPRPASVTVTLSD